jgi:hypothetical protein
MTTIQRATHLPPKTREAPPGPLGPSVVAWVSAPKTMNKFHFMRNEVGKLEQEYYHHQKTYAKKALKWSTDIHTYNMNP